MTDVVSQNNRPVVLHVVSAKRLNLESPGQEFRSTIGQSLLSQYTRLKVDESGSVARQRRAVHQAEEPLKLNLTGVSLTARCLLRLGL